MSRTPNEHQRYASPTRSSIMRAKPAANLRERVKNINERIDDLTYDHFSNSEQLEKNFNALNSQVKQVRSGFAEFGDQFLNELLNLKSEIYADMRKEIDGTHDRMNDLGEQLAKMRDDKIAQDMKIQKLELGFNGQLKSLTDTQAVMEQDIYKIKLDLDSFKDEQMRINPTIEDNKNDLNRKVGALTAELEVAEKNLARAETNIARLSNELGDMGNRFDYIQNINESNQTNLRTSLIEIGSELKLDKADKSEESTVVHGRMQEIQDALINRIEAIDARTEERLRVVRQEQGVLSNKLQTVSLEQERISTPVLSFDAKLRTTSETVNEDNRIVMQRIRDLETELKDIFTNISQMERSSNWKNDNTVRAIQSLARHLNIPSPLYSSQIQIYQMDSDDLLKYQEAIALKEEGNNLLKAGDYAGAMDKYAKIVLSLQGFLTNKADVLQQAGQLDEIKVLKQNVLNNMTMIDLKQQKYDKAIYRAGKCLELGINVKALYRRALAYMEINELDCAKTDLDAARREEPSNQSIRQEQERLNKLFQAQYQKQKESYGGFLK